MLQSVTSAVLQQQTGSMPRGQVLHPLPFLFPSGTDLCILWYGAESAHQKGATDQVEAMARDLEYTRAELASAKQNLDKAHSDQSKVGCWATSVCK